VKALRIALLVGGTVLALAGPAAAVASSPGPTVIGMRLSGVVDPFEASYVTSGIDAAEEQNAAAVLLTIDTPGGLDSSMRKIVTGILNARVPVICYVSPEGARAASAGTFILLACPVAAMAPGTNVGAAHPVGVSGAIEQSKATNDAAAFIRSIAEQRGRNADWAERAVRDSISASAQQALDQDVIDVVAPDTRSLLEDVDGQSIDVSDGTTTLHVTGATIEDRNLGIGAAILHALLSPDIAFIFFYLGLGLVVLGFLHHPLAAVLGAIFIAATFVSFGVLPVQLIGVVLLVASAVFFLLELKHPGLGLPTVGGVTTLVLGGLFLFNPAVPNARVSPWVLAPVAIFSGAFFAFVVKAALDARRLPRVTGRQPLVGAEGKVTSALEPRGVVQVSSERWTAESNAGPLPVGTTVRVVRVEGLRLIVEPIKETSAVGGREGGMR
jgi:membrane-bound serine protease (ClpP class)